MPRKMQAEPAKMDLTPFAKIVKDRCGLVLGADKTDILARAIVSRMSSRNIDTHTRYYESLLVNLEEIRQLAELLTVNETYFFREISHYDVFVNRLLPEILERKKGKNSKIKLLSAGCSSGEEPYSLAMALSEKYGLDILKMVNIIGCDINQSVIVKARQGIYGNYSFRNVNNHIRNKYFKPTAGLLQYKINEHIKNSVDFQLVNLLSHSYPKQIHNIDIIFYRNVSIYFKPDIQAYIFKKLADTLGEHGYIFTSATETMLHNIGILPLIECEGIFLYGKKINKTTSKNRLPLPSLATQTSESPLIIREKILKTIKSETPSHQDIKQVQRTSQDGQKQITSQELLNHASNAIKDKKYLEALSYIETLIKRDNSLANAYSLKANILFHLGRMEEARSVSHEVLRQDEWNLECTMFLGMISRIEGKYDDALKQFKTAIYTQPSCWLAHFYLGEIYSLTGARSDARREYNVAKKLMEKNGMNGSGLTYFPISYSVDQLIHLCKHNVAKLTDK